MFCVIFSNVQVFMLILICSTKIQCHLERFNILETGVEYNITVDKNNATEDEFPVRDLSVPKDVSSFYWCVEAALNNVAKDHVEPAEIILSNGKDVRAFKLPVPWYDDKNEKFFIIVKRQVQFCHDGHQTLNDSLRVIVNTRSVKPINVSLNVSTCSEDSQQWKEDSSSGKLSFTSESKVSLSQSVLKEFLPEKLEKFNKRDFLLIKIEQPSSRSRKCLIATILKTGCPNSDFQQGKRNGLKQTMRTRATFVIDPFHFTSGLVVSVINSPTGKECCENVMGADWEDCHFDTKMEETLLNVSITSDSSMEDYIYGILFILGFDFLVFVISVTVSAFGFVYEREFFKNVESEAMELEELVTEGVESSRQSPATNFISSADLESLGIEVNEKYAKRLKHNITLADLSRKSCDPTEGSQIYQKSDLHWRVVLILSLFYSIPTFQVVIWDVIYFNISGDQDYCYYNFLCLKPFGTMTAFNHVFSNIGYACYGILFMCLVNLKKRKLMSAIQKLDNFDVHKFGTPHDYSLFYGMGMALVMEGVMSACYHVCPTNIYFQFDTTYMYLIGILMIVKLYQNRHPDVSLGAIKTGILLGVLLLFEAISFYENQSVFWIIFCFIYLIVIIIVALHTYTLGALKYNHLILWNSLRLLNLEIRRALGSHHPNTLPGQITSVKIRLIFILILVLYNVGHVFYIIIKLFIEPLNYASTHLLVMIMANLAIYTFFYIIMKLVHQEYLTWSCRLYLVASLMLVSTSLYFFSLTPKNQDGSHAASRAENQGCLLFNFYDSHDLWHFLSAGGLFSTFMFLLNIDEDLKYTERRFIPVF